MLTQEEKTQIVLDQIGFVSVPQNKISDLVKDDVNGGELFMILGTLVQEGKIAMTMGPKGPEFSRKWNQAIDEERKALSKELNSRFGEETIFYPRFDGYVANIEDNFVGDNYLDCLQSYGELSHEYVKWHRNPKSGVVYPPKMHALNSSSVLTCNILAGLGLDPRQIQYASEYQIIASEPLKDKPSELSDPKTFFEAIVSYTDSVDFIQTSFLESFYQPFRQSMWAYQFGDRYLFDNEEAISKWREFARYVNGVHFDSYQAFKSMLAVYNDILANEEDYKGKSINVLSINFNLGDESKYTNLKEFLVNHEKEGRKFEEVINNFLATLPLPEGTTLSYQYLTISDILDNLSDDVKEYVQSRYLGF